MKGKRLYNRREDTDLAPVKQSENDLGSKHQEQQ